MADRPHIAFPFTRGPNGKVDVVEQDTEEHIRNCEAVIASYPLGLRPARPEFGWTMPTFRTAPLDPTELVEALRRFESRSQVTGQEVADLADWAVRHLEMMIPVPQESNG